jgi:phosphoadenosine phosphosulfate reductase
MTAHGTTTEKWKNESAHLASLTFPDEIKRAEAVVEWAVTTFGDALALTSSFQDAVMVNLVRTVEPNVEVVFLDTQYSFPETLSYRDQLTKRLHLNLRVIEPTVKKGEQFLLDAGTDACCNARKVQPLQRVLDGKAAWLSGIRRVETPERAHTPLAAWDEKRNLVKVSPIATWSDADVERYQREHDLPAHPLTIPDSKTGLVYSSIGCQPCTIPFRPGQDPRNSRWNGEKTECGLHV